MSSDSDSTSRALSVRQGRSLALSQNTLVGRGLQDIAQLGNRTHAEELVKQGDVLYKSSDYNGAIAKYTEAICLDATFSAAYLSRGRIHSFRDKNNAIADFSEAIRRDATFVAAYRARAWAYHDNKDYDAAIADHTEVIRLAPDNPGSYCELDPKI